MEAQEIKITKQKLKQLVKNVEKTAAAVNLIYVNDLMPGIERTQTTAGYIYKYKGRKVTNAATLARIKTLVIPPAWQKVWICADETGHLQATGFDVKNRKQYRYHPLWNSLRNHTKFFHLYDFGLALPAMRARMQTDLNLPGLPQEKVLALVVSLMQCTCIRIGNSFYEKMNGSFGLTTLKDQHVKISGQSLKFSFKGKKGVYHDVTLRSRKLAKMVQACRDIPGKELFQYRDEQGQRKAIDSGMVNNYIREISGGDFTAKDFRTWAGSVQALMAFKQVGTAETAIEAKRKIVEALDSVASHLNNTRTVCRKYYVHPALIDLYSQNRLALYLPEKEIADCTTLETELSKEEEALMKILSDHRKSVVL